MALLNVELGSYTLSDAAAAVLLEKLLDAYADGDQGVVVELGGALVARLCARIVEEEARQEKQVYTPDPYYVAVDMAVERAR